MTLRDRLRARQLPTRTVPLTGDRAAYEAAERELDEAFAALANEQARGSFDLDVERARVDLARSALDELPVERIVLRALPPSDWEALIAAHPAPADQPGAMWNVYTLRPELLAASVVLPEGEESPDWDEMYRGGHLTAAELGSLFNAAVELNARAPQVSTGKD